ncbi:hypothetical protein BC835DRAFT_1303779 [Cytidiella melzeri]|nr:hypothetical protein BC835DRAFT_1303779 [Cytidiella melzeri]
MSRSDLFGQYHSAHSCGSSQNCHFLPLQEFKGSLRDFPSYRLPAQDFPGMPDSCRQGSARQWPAGAVTFLNQPVIYDISDVMYRGIHDLLVESIHNPVFEITTGKFLHVDRDSYTFISTDIHRRTMLSLRQTELVQHVSPTGPNRTNGDDMEGKVVKLVTLEDTEKTLTETVFE